MAGFQTRRAVESDLPRLYDIWYHDEVAGEEDTPPPGPPLAGFAYSITRGEMRVAVDESGVITGIRRYPHLALGRRSAHLSQRFICGS